MQTAEIAGTPEVMNIPNRVTSRDGTVIAFDRIGSGPPLILVDGALCSRAFGPMAKLAPLLAKHFTVFIYDRRGRGESGDTRPYAREREIEDLAALIREAGGSAFVAGLSSGGALALEAARAGLPIKKVAAYEPPYVEDQGSTCGTVHQAALEKLLAAGDRGGAVKYFMGPMVGAPGFVVFMMQLMPWIWRKLKAVAHTLPYDAAVMGDFVAPTARLAEIEVPTLAMHGGKTDARLARAAESIARAIPGATHRVLAGQNHNVDAKVLAPTLIEFFR
jgi:pimeloyl-ACP methyl ester carboxylesterase